MPCSDARTHDTTLCPRSFSLDANRVYISIGFCQSNKYEASDLFRRITLLGNVNNVTTTGFSAKQYCAFSHNRVHHYRNMWQLNY
jgi:hypothetical protein